MLYQYLGCVAGRLVPAVMFFHIPIPEYDIAVTCGLSVSCLQIQHALFPQSYMK